MNILLLSAGGPSCHGVIKSLRDIKFQGKIISVDSNEMSAGFYLSDVHYVVPKAFDEDYISALLNIVKKEHIDLILPTSSNEIITISKHSHFFDSLGVQLFMSDYESIMICTDKLKFYEKCRPKIHSAGSRGVKVIEELSDNNCLNHKKYEYIFQEYLPGLEYTIDVLCDMKSNPLVAVPRKRLQTKEGISTKAEIVKNDYIEKICFDICKFLKLKGSICLQMKEDVNGKLKFIEINPRFGGGSYFATLAGVNFTEIILDLVKGNSVQVNKPKLVKIMRYYNEVVV